MRFTTVIPILILLTSINSWAVIEKGISPDLQWIEKYKSLDLHSEDSLENALKNEGPLSSWLTLKLADYYVKQEEFDKAANLLEKKEVENIWSFWKTSLLAQTYWHLKKYNQTLELLDQLPMEPEIELNPNQTFYRLLYKQTLQTKKEALKNRGKKASEIEAKIWALFGDLEDPINSTPPAGASPIDRILRAHVLIEKNLYKTLPEFIDLTHIEEAKISHDEKCLALYEYATSLRKLNKKEDPTEIYTMIIEKSCTGEPLIGSLYWQAKVQEGQKKYDQALHTYRDFIERFPDHRYTDDAYYSLWKIYSQLKQDVEASRAFSALTALTKGDMKNKVFWESAYKYYKENNFDKAIHSLDRILESESLGDEFHPQALYWKARCTEKLKKEIQAKILYDNLMTRYPFSFYAVMASHHLQTKLILPSTSKLPDTAPTDQISIETMSTIDLLNSLGFHEEAQQSLDYFTHQNTNLLEGLQTTLAKKWMESGDYNQALLIAADYLNTSVFDVDIAYNDPMIWALYPKPFPQETKLGAQKSGIPKGIIAAIMREESLLKTSVTSHAGAIGVMQLMPATAQIQAKKIAMTNFSLSDLTKPETNIILGSTFFEQVLSLFDENIPLAIMGYNAGPGNVRKWLKQKGSLPLDEFIEEIPFSETRGYVKRVLRSASIYGHLYNEPELTKPFFTMALPTSAKLY